MSAILDTPNHQALRLAVLAKAGIADLNHVLQPIERPTLKPQDQRALELAAAGAYLSEIAREMGYTVNGVRRLLQRHGVKAGSCKGRKAASPKNMARAEKMASMYRQGLALEKIGQHFNITRERVRQIISRIGVTSGDRIKKAGNTDSERKARLDANSMKRWGVTHDEMKCRRADGMIKAFEQQRNTSNHRGVHWNLRFVDWLAVWEASGKLALRGRGKGRYVMSRIKDEGGYVMGNVHVQLSTDNNSEGLKKCRNNKAANPGVLLMYPGLAKGWIAYVGHTKLGLYATEAEAIAARSAYLAEHPAKRGRGYSVVTRGRATRFEVVIGGKYVGRFRTPAEALSARAQALAA